MNLRDHEPLPADLSALLRLRDTQPEALDEALYDLGHHWIGTDTPTLLDPASYLSQAELADPSIATNIRATEAVCAHIVFVFEDDQSNLFGYWRGPENTSLLDAAIVKYDNEGQFALLQGRGLVEALIGDRVFDDEAAFAEHAERFNALGIDIATRRWHDLRDPQATSLPEQLHARLNEQFGEA